MEFFRIHKTIPFMKYALILNVISFVTFFAAVFFIGYKGLHTSIEFTGGTEMHFSYPTAPDIDAVRETIEGIKNKEVAVFGGAIVQQFGKSNEIVVRLPLTADQTTSNQSVATERIVEALATHTQGVELLSVQSIGPQVGEELTTDGLLAMLFVILGIIIYLSFRFEWKFAVAGVIANLHDVVIIIGFFAIFQWEFSLSVLAAILAVLGYSVNESVVIMDRIRENFRKHRHMDVKEVINSAITATISRTIITHGSTQMVVLSMFFFGGPTLHYFSLALTIGIWFGIYSSVFVAASLAMWLGVKREDLIAAPKKVEQEEDIEDYLD